MGKKTLCQLCYNQFMSRPTTTSHLLRRWHTIILYAVLGALIALLVSFLQPLRYSSTIRLLVLQSSDSSVDAFTASRSEERIADNLSSIVYTTTFFDEVMNAGFDIQTSTFSNTEQKRRKTWEKTIVTTVSRGTGFLTITAYHADVREAEKLARAVAFILTTQTDKFTSTPNVRVRVIDAPLNSRWPVKPNIPINVFSGAILGGLIGVGYVLLQTERIKRRHQLIHEDF